MDAFIILVITAFAATLVVLGLGIQSLAHGGKEERERSEIMMRRRVFLQAITLGLVLLALALSAN